MEAEKRKYPRYPILEYITVLTPKEKIYVAHSDNLSLGGLFLVCNDPLSPGTYATLAMTIQNKDERKEITARFRVAHNGVSSQGLPGMGVEFMDLSVEAKKALQELIDSFE